MPLLFADVTESNTRIDHEVQDFSNSHYRKGSVTILCHGEEAILEAIQDNNRFFISIYGTAQLLYSKDGLTQFDFDMQFIPTDSAIKAKEYLSHRMPLAEGFLQGAGECLNHQQFTVCVFLLHQVVEQCCIALINVNVAYRCEVHNLNRMLNLCRCFSNKPVKLFLSGNPEDQRLFDILVKSYSQARYGNTFLVHANDAKHLFHRVSAFLAMTKIMCDRKIEKLENEVVLYQQVAERIEAAV